MNGRPPSSILLIYAGHALLPRDRRPYAFTLCRWAMAYCSSVGLGMASNPYVVRSQKRPHGRGAQASACWRRHRGGSARRGWWYHDRGMQRNPSMDNIWPTTLYPHSQAGPLFLAAECNWARVVTLLLHHNADCTRKRVKNGWYPLHVAAKHGFEEVVEILLGELERLQAPLQVTARGQTAADLAAEYGHADLAKKIAMAQVHLQPETPADALPDPKEYVSVKSWCPCFSCVQSVLHRAVHAYARSLRACGTDPRWTVTAARTTLQPAIPSLKSVLTPATSTPHSLRC